MLCFQTKISLQPQYYYCTRVIVIDCYYYFLSCCCGSNYIIIRGLEYYIIEYSQYSVNSIQETMPTKIVQEIPATEHQQHQHQQRHAPQSDAEGDVATTVAEASPSMPTTLKLSFGNVDFSLVPTSSNGTVTFQANGLNEAVLNLNNFSGSLVIACNTANLVNRSSNNNNSSSCCNNNLVEDAASPSPDATSKQKKKTKVRTSAAAGQQQLTSWATCRKTGFSSQAPTPKMTNNDNSCKKNNNNTKRSSSQIEQIVQANRSSPSLQPYHSPVKRSRQVHGIPTPLATHLPPSPILLAQKTTHSYSKELDCSQTMSSQPTSQEEEEENEEDRLVSKQHPSFTDEDSVATHNADDDNVDVDMMDINNKMISSSSSSSSIKPMMADPSSQPSGSTTQDEVSTAFENTKTQTNISTVMKTPDPRWGTFLLYFDPLFLTFAFIRNEISQNHFSLSPKQRCAQVIHLPQSTMGVSCCAEVSLSNPSPRARVRMPRLKFCQSP